MLKKQRRYTVIQINISFLLVSATTDATESSAPLSLPPELAAGDETSSDYEESGDESGSVGAESAADSQSSPVATTTTTEATEAITLPPECPRTVPDYPCKVSIILYICIFI